MEGEEREISNQNLFEQPIPATVGRILTGYSNKDWEQIPINEAVTEAPKTLQVVPNIPYKGYAMAWPAYYKTVRQGLKEDSGGFGQLAENTYKPLQLSPLVKVRPGVAVKLDEAQEILDSSQETSHLQLVVVDGYRTILVQQKLYEEYRNFLQTKYPNIEKEKLNRLAQKMVSMPPSDFELLRKCPTPHSTGGSVDVILVEKSKINTNDDYWTRNAMINFGAYFDEMMHPAQQDARSAARYYEQYIDDDLEAQKNRRLLYNLMTSVGFTNYPFEFWHYDFGNQFNALSNGEQSAKYGFAGGLNNGRIIEDLSEEEKAFQAYVEGNQVTQSEVNKIKSHFGLQ